MSEDGPILLSDPLIGAMVGEYTIVDTVGEGGMGVVYRGVQPIIKKRVAVKVLKPVAAGDTQQVQRLVAEAEAVNAIHHRGIIDIFSLGTLPDGRPYVVMEFLEGEPLDARLRRGPLPVAEALALALEMCSALGAAHTAGVVHRDLKPSNVFLCRQADGVQYLKLLDFGLAKRVQGLSGSTAQTSQAVVTGTPDYMAPEQARGLDISPRTDLYALGVILFELVRGHVPFQGNTPMDVMMAHVAKPPPPLASGLGGLDRLVERLLAKSAEERPQASEVRRELEATLRQLQASPPRALATALPGALEPSPAKATRGLDAELPAPRPSKLPAIIALSLFALAVLATAAVMLRAPAQPAIEPAAAVDAGVPVVLAPTPAPSREAPVADAGAVVAVAPTPPADPGHAAPTERPPLTTSMLFVRMKRDEGLSTDPSAQLFLKTIARKLKADDSVASRRRTQRELDQWEKLYVTP